MVKFGTDALSEVTIKDLLFHIEHEKAKFTWASNVTLWPQTLTNGTAPVLTHKLDPGWTDHLYDELFNRGVLPHRPVDRIAMFYAWQPGSAITWHSDYLDKDSLTVYLSSQEPNDGGYFCWRDWEPLEVPPRNYGPPPAEARMRLPQFNHFVHMTGAEWHATTISSPNSKARLSLQMFFGKA